VGEVVVVAGGGVRVSREAAANAAAVLKAALRAGWLGTGDLAVEACLIVTFFEQREAGMTFFDWCEADPARAARYYALPYDVRALARDAFNAGSAERAADCVDVEESLTAENAALRARVAELEGALRPFAEWYAKLGEEDIDRSAVPAYRRAAELLSKKEGGGA
jgi:hypothetical protein